MLLNLVRRVFKRARPKADAHAAALEHYQRGDLEPAENYFREVARQNPGELSAWTDLAVVLMRQQKYAAAIPILLQALELKPDLAEAHLDLGVCYNRIKQNRDAIAHYERAIALNPELHAAHANLATAYLDACDWDAVDRWREDFLRDRKKRAPRDWAERVEPFTALMLFPGNIAREVAIQRSRKLARAAGAAKVRAAARSHDRIRVGYVSADFYNHPTAHLTYGLFEGHDRERFEIYTYSSGPDDGTHYRKHIERTSEHFVDIRPERPEATAARIRADEIDILVDMKGYTGGSRFEIFAHRPAPVQVAYLGYPGTTGADFIDYFVSDPIATPAGGEKEFTERIAYLPDSYQVNDKRQPISELPLSRREFGLPDAGFVYCSFNRLGKIDRGTYSVWMEILRAVPESVLWLIREDPLAEENLRNEAAARQVDPQRIVFSDKIDKPVHLARHRLADLFLDTSIFNAHTGASDALWAGLPVLTCPGATFITRVAASLLHAAGLPELSVRSIEEYRETAIRLAREPSALGILRARLDRQRLSCALFDTPRYVQNLEAAYRRMYEIGSSGRAAQSFAVDTQHN